MTDPVLFITWTTYGTWLPGDERGYVSNTLLPGGGYLNKQNRPGTAYTADHAYTREHARDLQKWPTVWLTAPQAAVVAESLVKLAAKRNWVIRRAAVMSNHVHAVVAGCPIDGEEVRRILKGNTQADLSRAAGGSRRWWTAGGSDRVRHGDRSIDGTLLYVANQRGKLAEVIENVVVIPDFERRIHPRRRVRGEVAGAHCAAAGYLRAGIGGGLAPHERRGLLRTLRRPQPRRQPVPRRACRSAHRRRQTRRPQTVVGLLQSAQARCGRVTHRRRPEHL